VIVDWRVGDRPKGATLHFGKSQVKEGKLVRATILMNFLVRLQKDCQKSSNTYSSIEAHSFWTAVDTLTAPYNVFKQSAPMASVTVLRLHVVVSREMLPPIVQELKVQLFVAAFTWYTTGSKTNDLSKIFI
jgi:hypothetical protein